jgi:phosphonate transport system permease protein
MGRASATEAGADAAVAAYERARAELGRARRSRTALFGALLALAVIVSLVMGEVSPTKLAEGLPGLVDYVRGTLPVLRPATLGADLAEWYWGLDRWLLLLVDTVLIAFMGTLLGTTGATLLCFPASATLAPSGLVYFAARRAMELARTVPELVWALIFVYAFGLGALPGVLAIAVHSMGSLAKLFSEINENVDRGPLEGVRAAGGSWVQVMRFGVVPQVLPAFASLCLLRFEINVRASSVVGFVGAGGIGQELYLVIRQFVYVDISAIVLLLVATVALIDLGCERIRHRLIGEAALAG